MSKRLLFIILVLLFVSAGAFAQVGGYSSTATDTTGKRLSLPTVKVCADALCSTTATIYKDASKTAQANPFTGDAQGNYSFFAAPGSYFAQVAKAGFATVTIPFSIGGVGDVVSSANNVLTGNNTHAGTETFNGTTTVPSPVNATDASRKDYTDTPAPFAGLANALTAGTSSTALQVIGDSTGNETSEWPYLFTQYLAAKYPAYTVKYWPWDDTISDYDPPTIIQTGTGGGTRTINFTGSANGVRLAAEDIPTFTVGGAIDIRYCFAPSSWRPGSNLQLLQKFTAPYRTLRLDLLTTGNLQLELSADGTATTSTQSTAAVTDTGANTSQCARATWVPGSPSTVTYYTGTDNVTWTQLGTSVSTATNTIFQGNNGTYDVGVDDWTLGGSSFTGKVTSVEMRNGVNGPILNPRNIDAWQILDTATYSGAPELNVLNASQPGAGLTYWMTASRQPFALTNFQQVVAMVSLSHNEGRSTGAGEMKAYGQLFSQIATATPTAHLIVLTQNPRTAPTTFINEHAIRRSQLMSWTGSPVGYDVIDTYRAFINDPRWASSPSTLVNPGDGIHPCNGVTICIGNPAGEQLWVSTVEAAFQRSINSQSSVYTGSAALPSYLTSTTGTGSTVLSNSPTLTGSVTMAAFTALQRTINNAADADLSDTIQCGFTVDKNCWTVYRGFSGTAYFQVGKTSGNVYRIFSNLDISGAGLVRLDVNPNGNTNINAPTSQSVQFNTNANSGGVVRFFSGGASPAQVAQVTSTGQGLFNAGVSPNGNINQMLTAGTGAPAAGNCTTAKGGSLYVRTDGTTTTTLYVCDGSTGVWTAK